VIYSNGSAALFERSQSHASTQSDLIVYIETGAARPIRLATSSRTREADLHSLSSAANSATTLPQAAQVFDKGGDVGCELIHELPSQVMELMISSALSRC